MLDAAQLVQILPELAEGPQEAEGTPQLEPEQALFALMDSSSSGIKPGTLRPDDGRLVRGRRSRRRIQRAAGALFRERGFDATTLRAIAARAGMGASSIY